MNRLKEFWEKAYQFFFPKEKSCPAYKDERWKTVDLLYREGKFAEANYLSNEIVASHKEGKSYCCDSNIQ